MGDEKHICRAPGIGKKTAGRIILELKDKLKKEDMVVTKGEDGIASLSDGEIDYRATLSEALGALLALGYSEKEAEFAISKANKEDTVENIIKNCLKILMG
jgi:Holliday junction DNA helicase RuvA